MVLSSFHTRRLRLAAALCGTLAVGLLIGCGRVGVRPTPLAAAGGGASGVSGEGGAGGASGDAGNCVSPCENAHGTAECIEAACTISCANGYADCDGDPTNGCEANTSDAVSSCGSCALSCANSHGASQCVSGLCAPTCSAGFGDCDADAENGCEADLTQVSSCGACGVSCANAHGTSSCSAGVCTPSCAAGFGECDGDATNGCETNLDSDPTHCGSCSRACGSNSQICSNGVCQASPCVPGRGECDGDLSVTCETDLASSLADCGFCGNACSAANGSAQCAASSCTVGSCNAGYADCDAAPSNGCEVQLSSNVAHCGSCATACTNAHGTTSCAAASCVPSCGTGYADCDGSRTNGCETDLNTVANCGMCGKVCPANGGTATCTAGVCGTLCNLTGSFALKLTVQGTWPNATYISGGNGTFYFWQKLQATHSGNSLAGTLIECGRYVPDFKASMVSETYHFQHPTALFDHVPAYLPSSAVTLALGSAAPGASVVLPLSALQMGVNMANPTTGSWPAMASGLTQIDMDADGKPGVTVAYLNGGSYDYPRTSSSLGSNRSDNPYIASRVSFSLNGTLTSCTQSTGSASVTHVDTRIFGCSLSTGSSDCSASEANFLDVNCLNYSLGTATYSLVKVADTATCADVRAALP